MLYKEILKTLGNFLLGFSFILLFPAFIAFIYQENTIPFLIPALFCVTSGLLLKLFVRKSENVLFIREGLFILILIGILAPILGAIPFILSKTLENPLQAYFESVSGLTTTGNTVFYPKKLNAQGIEQPYIHETHGITYSYYGTIPAFIDDDGQKISAGISSLPKCILFWRSILQWVGGASIIIIFLGILPLLRVGGSTLLNTETQGILRQSRKLRIREIFLFTGIIYLGLTFFQVILLLIRSTEVSLFDAINIAFCTISTGGFTLHSEKIGFYNDYRTIRIIIFFMILSAVNYSFYFYLLKGEVFRLFNIKIFIYFSIILLSGFFAAWYLEGTEKYLLNGEKAGPFTTREAFRHGVFQTVSALTTTGFATVDYNKWPYPVQVLLLLLTYIGGMSGSPAGGIKLIRFYMIIRLTLNKVLLFFRPSLVKPLRIGSTVIEPSEALTVFAFFFTAIFFAVLGTFLLVLNGVDLETSMALISSAQNNSGLSFGEAGPAFSCAFLSNTGLIITSLWMIFGRLEFFVFLVLFIPTFWKK